MIEEKYLPAGTVCMLKGGKKKVMIVGFAIMPKENPNTYYDYMGALYPEGIISNDQTLVFNHEQIETVYAKGYADQEQIEFNQKLKQFIANGSLKQAADSTSAPANSAPTMAAPTVETINPVMGSNDLLTPNQQQPIAPSIPDLQFEDV